MAYPAGGPSSWAAIVPEVAGQFYYDPAPAGFFVRSDADDYFRPGTVFLMMHCEPAGSNSATGGTTITNRSIGYGPRGGRVYQNYRRMVVVRAQHGCCWCLPVHTYQLRATTKPSVNARNHAIIYTDEPPPAPLPEEQLIFDPIRMIPNRPDFSLDRTSRLNFGSVHTVQHNVPVQPLGSIADWDLEKLEYYWTYVSGLPQPSTYYGSQ